MFHLSCTECGVELRLPDGNKVVVALCDEIMNDFFS